MIVLPYDRYTALEGNIGAFTDTSQLVALDTSDGNEMPVMIIDPELSLLLASRDGRGAAVDRRRARRAGRRTRASSSTSSGGAVSRHGLVLARSRRRGSRSRAARRRHAASCSRATACALVEPSDLASIVDTQIIDGANLRVTPVAAAGAGSPRTVRGDRRRLARRPRHREHAAGERAARRLVDRSTQLGRVDRARRTARRPR